METTDGNGNGNGNDSDSRNASDTPLDNLPPGAAAFMDRADDLLARWAQVVQQQRELLECAEPILRQWVRERSAWQEEDWARVPPAEADWFRYLWGYYANADTYRRWHAQSRGRQQHYATRPYAPVATDATRHDTLPPQP